MFSLRFPDPGSQPMQIQTVAAVQLDRGMGLAGAMSANILNMVGVGPFLTIPLALAAMGGPETADRGGAEGEVEPA